MLISVHLNGLSLSVYWLIIYNNLVSFKALLNN